MIVYFLVLLTGALAVSGAFRLVAPCERGLILDGRLHDWDQWSGFSSDDREGALRLFARSAGGAPMALSASARTRAALAVALRRRMAELSVP